MTLLDDMIKIGGGEPKPQKDVTFVTGRSGGKRLSQLFEEVTSVTSSYKSYMVSDGTYKNQGVTSQKRGTNDVTLVTFPKPLAKQYNHGQNRAKMDHPLPCRRGIRCGHNNNNFCNFKDHHGRTDYLKSCPMVDQYRPEIEATPELTLYYSQYPRK